ncbi:MAG: tRNA guanosine(34) transglycosylase Tgt [Deltaproteobacteria bacterium RIFCSPLOWO2_12_FULL_40_28]|nr:MAG: tRNA guanosine(34) transglycosylase Tgt [Deltaproteobacteria bacterium RIFCSPHIGHO2_02_FULL_40_28]OGQ18925.1 MAG: tRNA guanosine(34) transglycosylase Tgt [Deltaproteobacteria bacterium RIFCSPHIGHO2_12_FULL_40_32]OGQ39468.1 MAG: tRNA guanosine(34) transglycosylase Tgt [Deltaproteobacteria bacterium RIFCSPLOWO2_02_FULL_40_36]OGQ53358.1 MAG: tRNA guanosine(34) transglycosylase Tgt [Deltaproteobacteria bacterium RIFCSPLOWO2_12_FULL_40_28]
MSFSFRVLKKSKDTSARLGEIQTPHGIIQTPVFMPVGTVGTVKATTPRDLKELGAQIILGNTYHLYLRPGHELIKKLGGLHRFVGWDGPMLTDSGGYQVFSLGREDRQIPKETPHPKERGLFRKTKLAKISDEGVTFQSHIDGSTHFLSPEKSIEIQEALGADIIMAFDDCTAYPTTHDQTFISLNRTLDWERRSLACKKREDQSLFAIVQGGFFEDLRKKSVEEILAMEKEKFFGGIALGGLSVGEPIEKMYEMASFTANLLPIDRPRYLMGVGMPADLVTCIDLGMDMFDCVIPTRNARNGMLFTKRGPIQIKQVQYAEDPRPVEEGCTCYTCCNFSRAYLRHLHMAKEILSSILSTIHNLHYYLNLLGEIRLSIQENQFLDFKKHFFELQKEEETPC